MAKTAIEDPGTSGSQFFVVTGDDAQLPPEYALLGKVTKGQDVVDLIGVAPVGPDEQPVEPIVMESVAKVVPESRDVGAHASRPRGRAARRLTSGPPP